MALSVGPRREMVNARRAVAMSNTDRCAPASTRGVTEDAASGGFGASDGTAIKPTRSFAA